MATNRRQFLTGAALGTAALGTVAHTQSDIKRPGCTPKTNFAVNVEMWWRKEKNFLKRLEHAADLGFPAIEFWPWKNKDINAVAETCEKRRLQVAQFTAWGFRPGLNEKKNHKQFVERIEQGCEVAKKLKCKLMTVVGGDDVKGLTQEQMHENIIIGLKLAAPIAEKNGVTLILEPMNIRVDHKGHCLYGSAPTIRICQAVNSKAVKINWDLYHMQITEGDLCGHLREGKDHIGYVQLADHPGRNEPGTGEIHYPRVFQELKKIGYSGFVGLECRPKKKEYEAALAIHRADSQW